MLEFTVDECTDFNGSRQLISTVLLIFFSEAEGAEGSDHRIVNDDNEGDDEEEEEDEEDETSSSSSDSGEDSDAEDEGADDEQEREELPLPRAQIEAEEEALGNVCLRFCFFSSS